MSTSADIGHVISVTPRRSLNVSYSWTTCAEEHSVNTVCSGQSPISVGISPVVSAPSPS